MPNFNLTKADIAIPIKLKATTMATLDCMKNGRKFQNNFSARIEKFAVNNNLDKSQEITLHNEALKTIFEKTGYDSFQLNYGSTNHYLLFDPSKVQIGNKTINLRTSKKKRGV